MKDATVLADHGSVEQYKTAAKQLREMWRRVPTKSGRPSKGPRFFSVTQCQECGDIGLTSSKQAQRTRWACWGCGGCKVPVWSDGPTPDEDEIWEVWAKSRSKKESDQWETTGRRGHGNFVQRHGCSIRRQGSHCPWCTERA